MTAIKATFSDFRIIKTRKVVQLVMEIPLEAADNALLVLGGVPRPDAERWVGIAPITEKAAQRASVPTIEKDGMKPKRRMAELSRAQQAGILCNEREFQLFIAEREFIGAPDMDADWCAEIVRKDCGVDSRAKLDVGPGPGRSQASKLWDELRTEYDAWRGAIGRPE